MHMIAIVLLTLMLTAAETTYAADPAVDYPDKPIKIVVSAPAGGGVDTVTRIVAGRLQKILRQPVVIENRAGAGGNIGADFVFHANPDGYTLLAAQPSPLTINPLLYKNISFDATRFEPVAIMTSAPNVLLVRPNFPAKTASEFIEYSKANPGKVNFASQGIGTTSHLAAAFFENAIGAHLVHVPYRGTAPALNDIIGDNVDMIFMEFAMAIKLHESDHARILAVATLKRIPMLPDIPTLDELGLKGFESGTWSALVAPPDTPAAIIGKINKAVNDVLNSTDAKDLLASDNLQAEGGTSAEAAAFIKRETERWGRVIKEANVPPQ